MKKPREEDAIHSMIYALNPVKFAERVGFPKLDDWQSRFLLSEDKRLICCCGRQTGKTAVTAIKSLHEALYTPDGEALILLISPSLRQSREVFKRILGMYHELDPSTRTQETVTENKSEVEFRSGARILSIPSSSGTIRGFSKVTTCVCDESSHIDPDTFEAVLPFLAVSDGRLIVLSTPYGNTGTFHDWYVHGGDSWTRFHVSSEDCPRISPEFLQNQRESLSEWAYNQEYKALFQSSAAAFFNMDEVRAAFTHDVTPLDIDINKYLERLR